MVVALPDPRKGEQIVLITDKSDADRDALLAHARQQGFPELWVPSLDTPQCPIGYRCRTGRYNTFSD